MNNITMGMLPTKATNKKTESNATSNRRWLEVVEQGFSRQTLQQYYKELVQFEKMHRVDFFSKLTCPFERVQFTVYGKQQIDSLLTQEKDLELEKVFLEDSKTLVAISGRYQNFYFEGYYGEQGWITKFDIQLSWKDKISWKTFICLSGDAISLLKIDVQNAKITKLVTQAIINIPPEFSETSADIVRMIISYNGKKNPHYRKKVFSNVYRSVSFDDWDKKLTFMTDRYMKQGRNMYRIHYTVSHSRYEIGRYLSISTLNDLMNLSTANRAKDMMVKQLKELYIDHPALVQKKCKGQIDGIKLPTTAGEWEDLKNFDNSSYTKHLRMNERLVKKHCQYSLKTLLVNQLKYNS